MIKLKILEKDIRKQIKDYLNLIPCFYWWNLQGLGCYKGLPDIEGVLKNGIHFYIEIKRPNGTQNDNQIEFQKRVEEYGELYILAKDVDNVIEEFTRRIK